MNDLGETLERLVEADELRRDTYAWRHALATAAAIFGVVPFLARVAPTIPHAIVRGGTALWSAFALGWAVLALHGACLGRERRRIARHLAAAAANDEPRS